MSINVIKRASAVVLSAAALTAAMAGTSQAVDTRPLTPTPGDYPVQSFCVNEQDPLGQSGTVASDWRAGAKVMVCVETSLTAEQKTIVRSAIRVVTGQPNLAITPPEGKVWFKSASLVLNDGEVLSSHMFENNRATVSGGVRTVASSLWRYATHETTYKAESHLVLGDGSVHHPWALHTTNNLH
ncbi:hypothetical protein [Streptomyces sp. NPDC053431]|uniref:hypothetical protein n=1 Tax=Streptomyces sp. NPDC053431 TaxID=3365703 RepID=UPI0037CFEC34